MAEKKPFKWVDSAQAIDRLQGTYILYGNDPVYVHEIRGDSILIKNFRTGTEHTVSLGDPLFHEYRKLPPMGWMNVRGRDAPSAVFLKRIPIRGRRHGLTTDGVVVQDVSNNTLVRSSSMNIGHALKNKGYLDLLDGHYPSLEETLEKTPKGCTVAFSRKFAIYKDYGGLSFLYRNAEQVGLVSKDTLYTFPDTDFYKEELTEQKAFSLNIKEL